MAARTETGKVGTSEGLEKLSQLKGRGEEECITRKRRVGPHGKKMMLNPETLRGPVEKKEQLN